MGRCRIHGEYYGDYCSECREAAERAELDREEMIEKLVELKEAGEEAQSNLAYAINNPGEYGCPHCKLLALKMEASRCPRCHGVIDPGFWPPIRKRNEERLKEIEERRQIQLEQSRGAALAQSVAAAAQAKRRATTRFLKIYWGYLIPVLTFLTVIFVALPLDVVALPLDVQETVTALIPGVNWLFILAAAIMTPNAKLIVLLRCILGFWILVGVVLFAKADVDWNK